MHCRICDKLMEPEEISWNVLTKEYEPCRTCMEIILDAAYTDKISKYFEGDEDVGMDDYEVHPL